MAKLWLKKARKHHGNQRTRKDITRLQRNASHVFTPKGPLLQHALLSTEGCNQHRQLVVLGLDLLQPLLLLQVLLARALIPEADIDATTATTCTCNPPLPLLYNPNTSNVWDVVATRITRDEASHGEQSVTAEQKGKEIPKSVCGYSGRLCCLCWLTSELTLGFLTFPNYSKMQRSKFLGGLL